MGWLYVPGQADWNSDYGWQSPDIELWVTASGKPSLRPLSWRGWKTRPWIRLLSGTMWRRLMGDLGVGEWISSLPVTPASPFLSLDDEAAPPTPGTSGLISPESSPRWVPGTPSLRTSPTTSTSDSPRSEMNYTEWVTKLRQESSARLKWARHIFANDSSFWPSPKGSEGAGGAGREGRDGGMDLRTMTQEAWPTPSVEGNRNRHGLTTKAGDGLQTAAQQWATPTQRDYKDGGDPSLKVPTNALLGRQAPRTMVTGEESLSENHGLNQPSGRRLNPLFVEALMGLPIGWSDPTQRLDPTDFARWEMEWSRFAQRWLSEFYSSELLVAASTRVPLAKHTTRAAYIGAERPRDRQKDWNAHQHDDHPPEARGDQPDH